MPKSAALLAACALAKGPGGCRWCGAALPPRARTWCSPRCGDSFWANHWWTLAREAAKRRDKRRCRRCGHAPPKRPAGGAELRAWRRGRERHRLEINHIAPCLGAHGTLSCAHHLDNLETLCVPCHKAHTGVLRARRQIGTMTA